MAPPVRNARDVINGIGYNYGGGSYDQVAVAMQYAGTRWMRVEVYGTGDVEGALASGIQAAFVARGYNNPNLKVQLLCNDYLAFAYSIPWNAVQSPLVLRYCNGDTVDGRSWKDSVGRSLVWAVEGGNEINTSNFYRGEHGETNYDPGGEQAAVVNTTNPVLHNFSEGGANDPAANAAFKGWAQAMNATLQPTLRNKGIELLSPTFNGYYLNPWQGDQNVAQWVDFGCYHWYSDVPPSAPSNNVNLYRLTRAAAQGIMGNPNSPMVLSEGPVYTPPLYGDQNRVARTELMAICDFFAAGNHRMMMFELMYDQSNQNGTFGLVTNADHVSFTPFGHCIHNFTNILSLNNNYAHVANNVDLWADPKTPPPTFTPGYNSTNLTVSGVNPVGEVGSLLVMPKSDGSTIIAVWNEPAKDNTIGTQSANPVTVNFGSSQSYKVYDVSGSGGNQNMNAQASTTPYLTGTSTSVNITLYGMPVLIEISGTPPPTVVPGAVTGVAVSTTTSTEAILTWNAATQSPNDYIITVTEL